MRFLLDASVRSSIGEVLRQQGQEVRALAGTPEKSLPDDEVLLLAYEEDRILITNDKDFGTLVFAQKKPHHGVVLFRLHKETKEAYHQKMRDLLATYNESLRNGFIVATDAHVRFRRM